MNKSGNPNAASECKVTFENELRLGRMAWLNNVLAQHEHHFHVIRYTADYNVKRMASDARTRDTHKHTKFTNKAIGCRETKFYSKEYYFLLPARW